MLKKDDDRVICQITSISFYRKLLINFNILYNANAFRMRQLSSLKKYKSKVLSEKEKDDDSSPTAVLYFLFYSNYYLYLLKITINPMF